MSSTLPKSCPWDENVIELAKKEGVEQYVQPLWEAIHELFPNAESTSVSRVDDPELRDVSTIFFEVHAPIKDGPEYVEAHRRWSKKLFAICPAPLVHNFGLFLRSIRP